MSESQTKKEITPVQIREIIPTMEQLLEAGVHFGHQSRRWNPKMAEFIYKKQNQLHLIDLAKTYECLARACLFLANSAAQGKKIVLVGTKRQASAIVRREASLGSIHYVDRRWLGGFLTNFDTLKHLLVRYNELEADLKEGKYDHYTKRERLELEREINKLEEKVGGVRSLDRAVELVVLIDPRREKTAVREARRCGVPIVALIDTNSDPTLIDYPVPGNDDAISSITLILATLVDSILLGLGFNLSKIKELRAQVKDVPLAVSPKRSARVSKPSLSKETKRTVPAKIKEENISLESLGLSTRAFNALNKAGYTTVKKVIKLSPEQLAEVKGLGEKTIKEITRAIKKLIK
ncbi:30S ribosomal protein S2 [candidate division WWE3 bacterium CG08_land_8_20_14_0_20_43_13]|uniref:Small ribosomal subunit protein uS2 n=1 Tax=candidate division WWE3 bacterium CG08_land_8_20_14_0_20_43_13 TaxID=1975087 RepID=A0A2H0X9Q3_UNCKA|nr:MAG: 30S ribosomal protein S2 [candidate division WWE3 bacterium CG08_land_8_20_14_0_20_43_13]